jgi:hypothetical protein
VVEFWLDADCYIESAKGRYRFSIAPGFWELVKREALRDAISSPVEVYHEIREGEGELVAWVEGLRDTLFTYPDESVQSWFRQISDHVSETYTQSQASKFLSGADGWLIAHARAHGGAVVTGETRAGPNSPQATIPNVCEAFSVECINLYDMLERLGVTFHLHPPRPVGEAPGSP